MSNDQASCVFPKLDPSVILDYPTSEWPTARAEDLSGQMFAVRKDEADNMPHENLKHLADMDGRIWYTSNCREPGGHSNSSNLYVATYQLQVKQMHAKSGRKRDKNVQKKVWYDPEHKMYLIQYASPENVQPDPEKKRRSRKVQAIEPLNVIPEVKPEISEKDEEIALLKKIIQDKDIQILQLQKIQKRQRVWKQKFMLKKEKEDLSQLKIKQMTEELKKRDLEIARQKKRNGFLRQKMKSEKSSTAINNIEMSWEDPIMDKHWCIVTILF